MALNFPNNPGIGSVYIDTTSGFGFQWDGTVWSSYSPASSSNIKTIDDISGSFNGITTSFSLATSGVTLYPSNSQSVLVNLGGVPQKPGVDFYVVNNNILFTDAPTSGLTFSGTSLGPAVPIKYANDGNIYIRKQYTGAGTTGAFLFTEGYSVGYLDVYRNGIRLRSGIDFVGTSGTDFYLTDAAQVNDEIEAIGYSITSLVYATGNLNSANIIGLTTISQLNVTGNSRLAGVTTVGNFATSGTVLNPTNSQTNLSFGQGALPNNTGTYNIAIGQNALSANTSGLYNVAVGYGALANSTVNVNTALGYNALTVNTSGTNNTAVGGQTLQNNQSGGYNIALGQGALVSNQTGSNNVAAGYQALANATASSSNNAIGYQALSNGSVGSNNNAFGYQALLNSTGSNNVAIGDTAGYNQTSGNNNVIIGSGANVPILTGSNQLAIGAGGVNWLYGNSSGNLGIGTTNPSTNLHVLSSSPEVILVERSSSLNTLIQYRNSAGSIYAGMPSSATGWAVDNDNNLSTSPLFLVQKTGEIIIGGGNSTGTASQNLQVTAGGAYVSGSVGIGTTNPNQLLQVGAASSQAFVVDSSGNAGLGTVTPSAFGPGLSVYSNSNASYGINVVNPNSGANANASILVGRAASGSIYGFMQYNGTGVSVGTSVYSNPNAFVLVGAGQASSMQIGGVGNYPLAFYTNNLERVRIDGSGNVGIGTTNPTAKLDIFGGPGGTTGLLRLITSGDVGVANTTTFLRLNDVNGSAGAFGFGGTANQLEILNYKSGPIRFSTNNTEALRIDSSQRVGIGTTNPSSLVDIRYSSSTAYSPTATPQTAGSLTIFNTDTTVTTIFSGIALGQRRSGNSAFIGIECVGTGNDATALAFKTQSPGPVFAEVMRLTSGGSVGIGTTNPSQQLHIASPNTSSSATIFASDSGGRGVLIQSPYIGNAVGKIGINGTDSAFAIGSGVGNTTAIFIDTSQRVGIGTTNPTSILHLKAGTATANTAPLKINAGTNLTTPEADAFEYDGVLLYHTQNDTTNGNKRALIPEVQYQRRTGTVSITAVASPGTSIFGATTRPALLAGNVYEIEAMIWMTKVTNAGTLTLQASLSTGNFTFASLQLNTSATTQVLNGTVSPVSLPATTSLTAGTTYGVVLKGVVQPASNARLDILAFCSATSLTVESSSFMKVTCVGTATSIGNFA